MSEIRAIELPKWGMTMEEGVLDQWLLPEGSDFDAGAALCSVETEKISNELEAPFAGHLRRLVGVSGETYPVGALIAVSADASVPDDEIDAFVASRGAAPAASAPAAPAVVPAAAPAPATAAVAAPPAPPAPVLTAPAPAATGILVPDVLRGEVDESVFATPHAVVFAREHGVALGAVVGSGPDGRVSVADIEQAIVSSGGRLPAKTRVTRSGTPPRSTQDDSAVAATPVARRLAQSLGLNLHDVRATGTRGRVCRLDVEEAARRFGVGQESAPAAASAGPDAPSANEPVAVPFNGMRRTIAQRLQSSYLTSPHFRVNQEIVLDDLLALRRQINDSVPGVRVSVNDMIVKAVATALVAVPEVNVQFDEATQTVLRFPNADVSVAVAIPDGLITPIVREANRKTLAQISAETTALVGKAKSGKLQPHEFQGGTFSVSNLGMLGVTSFDAIINPPQAAILAIGAGIRRPVVDASGDVVVRTVMEVSLASDHRVIDGALAATFVGEVKAILEAPTRMLV
ncbi:dihydrolipoamide acetyltransferase family protein [Microbacterium lacticum]|uniref:dihydrolipoamide acetyltransferase family protein n=1 Tax=Microbacterium lacticum TaxID=33885 RepID=UPI003A84712A